MEYLPIFRGGKPAGKAAVERQPPYTRIRVRTASRVGIWRAWLIGESGEIRIGALEPDGNESVISRGFSRQALSAAGRLLRVELRPDSPENGGQNNNNNNISERREPPNTPGILKRRVNQFDYIAFPYDNHQPFPMPELFCFARLDMIDSRQYWIFAFNHEKWPVIPSETPF